MVGIYEHALHCRIHNVLVLVLLGGLALRAAQLHGLLGLGLVVALVIADSFQANWKHEAMFLAVAALSIAPCSMAEHNL